MKVPAARVCSMSKRVYSAVSEVMRPMLVNGLGLRASLELFSASRFANATYEVYLALSSGEKG
eukprot:m.309028 g.309028  ORF g.309028 m.309028 type:complete len:63 (+) comp55335_c0_seq7:374-562(+)